MPNARPLPAFLVDGPADSRFWTGEIASRLPAVFRIGLGAILLGDALLAIPDVSALYGVSGVWPAQLARGLLAHAPDPVLYAFWATGCLALLAFASGLFTRFAAAASWVFLVTLHQRNAGITTGGDFLAQILLFFCIFLDCGAALSLDAKWRGKAREFVAAAPLRAMQLHVAILYLAAARLKVRAGWLDGDGVFLSLQHDGFVRPLGAWLRLHPDLCELSTWVTVILEFGVGLLAFAPVWPRMMRLGSIACALAVQLGIISLMRVGMFTPLMLWVNVLLLPAAVRASGAEQLRLRTIQATASAALVIAIAWPVIAARRFPMPQVVSGSLEALGLAQPYDLFGATYEVATWHAVGTAGGAEHADVVERVEPGLQPQVGWRFATAYKLTFATNADHAAIARWLCREYEQRTGTRLDTIRLFKHARQPAPPGNETPYHDVTLYEGACTMKVAP